MPDEHMYVMYAKKEPVAVVTLSSHPLLHRVVFDAACPDTLRKTVGICVQQLLDNPEGTQKEQYIQLQQMLLEHGVTLLEQNEIQ